MGKMRELMQDWRFAVSVIVLVILTLPFGIEYIGDTLELWKFPATDTVKGWFASKTAKVDVASRRADWAKQNRDFKEFSNWVSGMPAAKIEIVRPEEVQIVRGSPNPVTTSTATYKLLFLARGMNLSATQVREKLVLQCETGDASAQIGEIRALSGKERGYEIVIHKISGEGKIGLAWGKEPPVLFDVKLRGMWRVPVSGCRAAVKDRFPAEVLFPGMTQGLGEGGVISPGSSKCGYRVLGISDYCVWFEAFYGDNPPEENFLGNVWPDFSRIDTQPPTPPPGRLIFGKNRCFWPGDAIKLPSSGSYLLVDDFLDGRAVVFRLLDGAMRHVRDLLCVIVRER